MRMRVDEDNRTGAGLRMEKSERNKESKLLGEILCEPI